MTQRLRFSVGSLERTSSPISDKQSQNAARTMFESRLSRRFRNPGRRISSQNLKQIVILDYGAVRRCQGCLKIFKYLSFLSALLIRVPLIVIFWHVGVQSKFILVLKGCLQPQKFFFNFKEIILACCF